MSWPWLSRNWSQLEFSLFVLLYLFSFSSSSSPNPPSPPFYSSAFFISSERLVRRICKPLFLAGSEPWQFLFFFVLKPRPLSSLLELVVPSILYKRPATSTSCIVMQLNEHRSAKGNLLPTHPGHAVRASHRFDPFDRALTEFFRSNHVTPDFFNEFSHPALFITMFNTLFNTLNNTRKVILMNLQ